MKIIAFLIASVYCSIGYKVANKLEAKDSYEKHIIACAFPAFLMVVGIINLIFKIKEKTRKWQNW